MLPAARYPRHACPLRAAEEALLLLATGRVDMARAVVERLPALIADALSTATRRAEALDAADRKLEEMLATCDRAGGAAGPGRGRGRPPRGRGQGSGRPAGPGASRAGRRRGGPGPATARPGASADRVAYPPLPQAPRGSARALASGAVTPDRVAAVLGMTPGNVREIATGKVGLSTTYWRRVLALLEPEEP